MKLQQAREEVVAAGKRLIEAGLIARTWGNVSARAGRDHFVITPSGRAYENLAPEEIVPVKIADGSYSGEIKPSSEKGIHVAVYRQRPEINFIIHTHQAQASAVSTLHRDIEITDPAAAEITGSSLLPCAAYGLPGTKKLMRGVVAALSRSRGKAFLMANHGALCLGEERGDAFRVAAELERLCAAYIMQRYLQLSGSEKEDWDDLRAYYLEHLSAGSSLKEEPAAGPLYSSEREKDQFHLYPGAGCGSPAGEAKRSRIAVALDERAGNKGFPPEAEMHRLIYRRYKGIGAIVHAAPPDILTVSQTGRTVYPLLDDFTQIVGVSARSAAAGPLPEAAGAIARKLRGRYAVMLEGRGALCCGPSRSDAAAAVQVLEKGCRALIGAAFFGGAGPVNPVEARLMRFIYLAKYARMAGE